MSLKKGNYFKSFQIPIEIYNAGLWVVISPDIPKVINILNKRYSCNDYSESQLSPRGGCLFMVSGYYPTLWLRTSKIDAENISVIGHECLHVVQYIMELTGTPQKEDTNEPAAYLLGYLIKKIMKKII